MTHMYKALWKTHISKRARLVRTSVAVMLSPSAFSLMKCLRKKKQDFLQTNNQLLLKLCCSLTRVPAPPAEKRSLFPSTFEVNSNLLSGIKCLNLNSLTKKFCSPLPSTNHHCYCYFVTVSLRTSRCTHDRSSSELSDWLLPGSLRKEGIRTPGATEKGKGEDGMGRVGRGGKG